MPTTHRAPDAAPDAVPTYRRAAGRAAAVVRAPGFTGQSYREGAQVPGDLRSSNQWRRQERRRPRADAVPVARVIGGTGWHPLYDRASTEPTRRADREREVRDAALAPDLSDFVAAMVPPRGRA